jgi:hypothetical protein
LYVIVMSPQGDGDLVGGAHELSITALTAINVRLIRLDIITTPFREVMATIVRVQRCCTDPDEANALAHSQACSGQALIAPQLLNACHPASAPTQSSEYPRERYPLPEKRLGACAAEQNPHRQRMKVVRWTVHWRQCHCKGCCHSEATELSAPDLFRLSAHAQAAIRRRFIAKHTSLHSARTF